MTEPRKPDNQEKNQLAYYLVIAARVEVLQIYELIESAAIAVFDDSRTISPGYVGKIMTVIWRGGPEMYEVFIWRNDKIVRVAQDPQFQVVEPEL